LGTKAGEHNVEIPWPSNTTYLFVALDFYYLAS